MTTVAYTMGAVRVAANGALIQEANAVESTSNVNLLCLDKTGTLTTNRVTLDEIRHLTGWPNDREEVRGILGDYAASTSAGNRTIEAIRQSCSGQPRQIREEVPFSSERRWSALTFDDDERKGTYVLGAPEVLLPRLLSDTGLRSQIDGLTTQGLRVLLFARDPGLVRLYEETGGTTLPSGLIALALLSFREELRPRVRETLKDFADLGVRVKIISGDNPLTVAALATQVGLGRDLLAISGLELAQMDDEEFERASEAATVFGRVAPDQKERLVQAFRQRGYHVAMIGDGVNDVLSLKRAHLGIAMQSGSAATRSVADMVLLGDSFGVLPTAVREGQRIIKGMEDVVRLLLTRTLYVFLLIVAALVVGVDFPITPKHNSILALLTVGIPILAIAAWARPGDPPRSVIRTTSSFVFPAAFTVSVAALGIYLYFLRTTGDAAIAQTALTTLSVLCGLVLVPFVEPPTPGWVGGDVLSGDWRPTILAVGMLFLYGVLLVVPPLRAFFELRTLPPLDYLLIGAVALVWAVILRYVWRVRLFERLLVRST
jgi:cation-transporting ATPase E